MNARTKYDVRGALIFLGILVATIFLSACGATMVKDADGNKTPASIVAQEEAEKSARDCRNDGERMHEESSTNFYTAVGEFGDAVTRAILLTVASFNSREAISNIIDACGDTVEKTVAEFNTSDRQQMKSGENIVRTSVGAGLTLGLGVVAGGVIEAGYDAAKGDSYTNVGGRQVVQTDSIQTRGNGLGLEILNSGDTTATPGPTTTTPNGAVSSSGDGDLIGNTFNVTVEGGSSINAPVGGAISSEPFTGEFIGGEGAQSVTTQPITETAE